MAHLEKPKYNVSNPWMKHFYNVSHPVGPGMPNHRSDVALVQTLYNMSIDPNGEPLKVDGRFGPKTQAAIVNFQQKASKKLIEYGVRGLQQDGIISRAHGASYKDGPGQGVAFTITAMNFWVGKVHHDQWRQLPKSEQVPLYLRKDFHRVVHKP